MGSSWLYSPLLMFGVKVMTAMIPIPVSISYMWNFGSLLGINLMVQVVSGLLLAFNYEASVMYSFESVLHICNDVWMGWVFRFVHANGASFFFILMYIHIGRGMYYGGYKNRTTWLVGVSILLVSMGVAFLGYVLPWGQMSLWGATVITNLLSAIPYIGSSMIVWFWGGFSVGGPTLVRFFSLHFILPFLIVLLVMIHMISLHNKGSSNTLGCDEQADKVSFHPYFTYKDIVSCVVFLVCLGSVVMVCPDVFMDPDNFSLANPLVTPPHIQPEWYFLFAYAVLRSIPSKLGGVIGLIMTIVVLYPAVLKKSFNIRFKLIDKMVVLSIFSTFLLLTWAGSMPAEYPLVEFSKIISLLYFILIMMWLCL